jgi:hypothetical protein
MSYFSRVMRVLDLRIHADHRRLTALHQAVHGEESHIALEIGSSKQ